MTTTPNDEMIAQLLSTIENLSAEIAAEEAMQKRASWRTTCSVQIAKDNTINLQVANQDQLRTIAVYIASQLVAQREAVALFGIEFAANPSFQGFPITDWVADVNKRMAMLTFSNKRKNLEIMQKRAKELLSFEQKRGLELQELLTQMKELTK